MKTHLIWLGVAVAALLVGTQFAPKEIRVVEKPVEVVKTRDVVVEKRVDVIKEVPKEVEKIVERTVEVPAKIPELYTKALAFMERFYDSKQVSSKDSLAGIKSVRVSVYLADDIKKIVSETEIRTKFEITLRRSGVPIDEKSLYVLSYSQDGFTRTDSPLLVYSISTNLDEGVFALRNDGPAMYTFSSTE
ncbi:MAG: hypothetical protein WCL04_04170 [Verrucomicrobiota bacterium]